MAEVYEEGSQSTLPEMKRYNFKGLMDTAPVEAFKPEEDESYVQRLLDAPEEVAKKIEDRGSLWGEYDADTSAVGVGKTFLRNISLPGKMIEGTISNPIIEMQKGNFNPIDILSESAKGFAGIKQGQYGDVARMNGVSDNVSAGLGLATSFLTPLALAKLGKSFSAVSKFADKKILKAVTSFFGKVQGQSGAMRKVGSKVGAYYDDIGAVSVNKDKFLDEIVKMSTAVKKAVTDLPSGKIAQVEDQLLELAQKGDVFSVHSAKEVVDDLIVNFFSTGNKTKDALKKTSQGLGNIIDEAALYSKTRELGSKAATKYINSFKKARKDYSVLKSNFGAVRQKLINPKTGDPTQTGSLLSEISDPRNIDLRHTLEKIDKYGTGANKFARDLEKIEGAIKFREFAGSAVKSAGRGLVIGATAGALLKAGNKDNNTIFEGK